MKKPQMTFPARLLLIGFCVISLVLAFTLFVREHRAAFLLRGTMNEQIEGLSSHGSLTLPVSARSIRDLLTACGRILTTAPRVKAEPETAAAVRASCAELSGAILVSAPGNARALAVELLSAVPEVSSEDLATAQQAAPYEPWPLAMRLEVVARASPQNQGLLAVAEADFVRALLLPWGRDYVARLYASWPDLRGTIRRAAQVVPNRDQQSFARALRSANMEAD